MQQDQKKIRGILKNKEDEEFKRMEREAAIEIQNQQQQQDQ